MKAYILVSVLWIGYFFLHSLLASVRVKQHFNFSRGYRLFYSIFSTILLAVIFLYLSTEESNFVFPKSRVTELLGLVLAAYGVIVIRMSFKQYGIKEFFGLKDGEDEAFKEEGILSRVRHPIYAGTILIVLGFVLYIPRELNVLSAFWIFVYLPLGIWLEEKKLVAKYGRKYEAYRSRVPAIFPNIF